MSSAKSAEARVAANATQTGALNRSAATVIGIFGREQDLQAMVRMPGGSIRTMTRGASLSGGRIAAIDRKGVILQKGGETVRLVIPGS